MGVVVVVEEEEVEQEETQCAIFVYAWVLVLVLAAGVVVQVRRGADRPRQGGVANPQASTECACYGGFRVR